MSYREKREQLKKQIDELNGLVEQLRKVGPKHRTYTKYRLALLTSGMRNVIRGIGGALFAIATRHCVSFGMGSLDTPLYMLGMTALFILVGIFMGGWTAEDAGWVSCN